MEHNLSIEERISLKLTEGLKRKIALSEIEEAKISYGVSVGLISFVKVFLIYFTAALLGTMFETVMCHLPFCMVRHYSRGFHAKSSFNCGVSGIVLFSIIPWSFSQLMYRVDIRLVMLLGLISMIILYIRAPGNTTKNQVQEQAQRLNSRRKAIMTYLLLFVLIVIIFKETEQLIVLSGLSFAVILTLPLEKIFWRNQK